MSITKNPDGSLSIATMSLTEMLPEVEKAILSGYRLDIESNIGWPQVLGSLHLLTMFPEGDIEVSENNTVVAGEEHEKALEEALEVAAPKIDGRKRKT